MSDHRAPDVVIVDHWMDTHPGEADPSWPTVARATVAALEAAGHRVVQEVLVIQCELGNLAVVVDRDQIPAALRGYFDRAEAEARADPHPGISTYDLHGVLVEGDAWSITAVCCEEPGTPPVVWQSGYVETWAVDGSDDDG